MKIVFFSEKIYGYIIAHPLTAFIGDFHQDSKQVAW